MPPLVSILIPAYNAELWIADTLRSALAQTWPNKEIIVVDDGSKDNTRAIAQTFAATNVKVATQPNQGAAAARNKAFSLCHGDYIQWLDADDLLSEDKVARQMAAVERQPGRRALFSCGWGRFYCRPHKASFSPTLLWENLTPLEWMLRKWENNLYMQTGTWLVSRELAQMAGPWDTRLLGDDDGEYFSRVIRAADRIVFVPTARVFYRVSGPNRLSYIGRSNKKMDAQFVGMKMQIGYLRSLADDARARAACVTYLQNWLVNFYPHRMDIVEEARQLAAELGGALRPPKLSWKYNWIQQTMGWTKAIRAQLTYNAWKSSLLQFWDGALDRLETGFAQTFTFHHRAEQRRRLSDLDSKFCKSQHLKQTDNSEIL
jgi:glycosyltransferase involved in cell wall biosynthesis